MPAIRCFLIEPVFSTPYSDDVIAGKYCGWPPHRTIASWTCKETGEERTHNHEWGVGAMWFSYWLWKGASWDNETEPHLHVRCPNGDGTRDWDIDSRASNCKLPEDRLHRCWIRHGEPPLITVDKNGFSCSAGAGSIALPKWHGFLRNGELAE